MKKTSDDVLIELLSLLWKGGVAVYETFAGSSKSGKEARDNVKREFESKSAEWREARDELEKLKQE
nr:hypothetical protein [uncultured Haemophilus sp.]